MNKLPTILLFLVCVLGVFTACSSSAEEGAGKESSREVMASGCLDTRSDGEDYEKPAPSIVLAKEGDIVSCQLFNFEYNCFVYDFNVVSDLQKAFDGTDSLSVKAVLVDGSEPLDFRCLCHYNISFVIRNVTADKVRFHCAVPNRGYSNYDGTVTFSKGNTVVLTPAISTSTVPADP